MQHANLTGADLRGADVSGADFSGAQASQATLTTVYVAPGHPATGLPPGVAAITGQPQLQPSCLANPSYGDPPVR